MEEARARARFSLVSVRRVPTAPLPPLARSSPTAPLAPSPAPYAASTRRSFIKTGRRPRAFSILSMLRSRRRKRRRRKKRRFRFLPSFPPPPPLLFYFDQRFSKTPSWIGVSSNLFEKHRVLVGRPRSEFLEVRRCRGKMSRRRCRLSKAIEIASSFVPLPLGRLVKSPTTRQSMYTYIHIYTHIEVWSF